VRLNFTQPEPACGRPSCYRRSSTWTHHANTQATSLATSTSARSAQAGNPGIPITIRRGADTGVSYTDDCQPVAESGRRTFRSAERSVCVIQRCNNTFGDRSFAVAGPRAWNDLLTTIRNTELTTDTFCKHLKTVLFTDSWGRGAFVTFWYYHAVYKCPYLLTYCDLVLCFSWKMCYLWLISVLFKLCGQFNAAFLSTEQNHGRV